MTDIDLMTDHQMVVMAWLAGIAWAYLLGTMATRAYRRRHPRRATYRPTPGRIRVDILSGSKHN